MLVELYYLLIKELYSTIMPRKRLTRVITTIIYGLHGLQPLRGFQRDPTAGICWWKNEAAAKVKKLYSASFTTAKRSNMGAYHMKTLPALAGRSRCD